jgi:N-acetylmuramoyl-L-alanine amidase
MKVFINPGHDVVYDSGAVNPNNGIRECDIALDIGQRVKGYLEQAGCEVMLVQSDSLTGEHEGLPNVCGEANAWLADIVVSIHCNAANTEARGTEVEVYRIDGGNACKLADCIRTNIVKALGTIDRGNKERNGLAVLRCTDVPAVLVETAFIDNDEDAELLVNRADDFARAIAVGITDYEQE